MDNHDKRTDAAQSSLSGCDRVDRLTRAELAKPALENRLRFWEKVRLKLRGRSDGKANLPAADASGCRQSPFLKQVAMEYSEYETKIWATIQADLYPLYSRALKILDDMKDADEMRDYVSSQLPPYPTEQELCQIEPGEEKLNPIAVRNRRIRAYKNEIARINAEIYAQIGRISADSEELSEISNSISESEKAARLLCSAKRDQCFQRVTVYWRAAMRKNKTLDPLPTIIFTDAGEALYDEKHRDYRERISAALSDKYFGGVTHEN